MKKLTTKAPYLFPLDGGNDATETLRVLQKCGHFFLVKRNLRRENPLYWLDIAKSVGKNGIHRNLHGQRVCR
ncbi:MAG: hypothetical protein K9M94_15045 [Spirochaetia bacterium]|nr:hypothetical protein [Spirochaetia bacterium]